MMERWRWGDPMEVAMRAEGGSCKNCTHERKEKWFGKEIARCMKDRKHGVRCGQYREAPPKGGSNAI